MYHHEHTPIEWFQSRSFYYPPMSRPVSKSFNRISDFIFPDTLHLTLPSQHQQSVTQHYQRIDNHSLPVLNRRDLIIVERLPVEEFDNIDLLYREQQYYQPNRQIRRRYSSIADERRISSNDKNSIGLANRSIGYRERIRDRRKRHTTDNVYHSMLKSMLEKDEQQKSSTNNKNSNYILSYQTTLDPITDSESIPSLHEEKNNEITHCRVPINGTIPITTERRKQRQHNSSISSRDSSSDTDIAAERRPIITNNTHYQQDSSIWERLPSSNNQSKRFIPINSSFADTNNHQTISHSNHLINSSPFDNVINYDSIDNQTLSQDSTHHVSLCVNDLHTTLFIDENTLNNNNNNNTKTINNGGKAIIKTFIDRIIKRLQHFKHSLDNGLIQIRKPTTNNEIIKPKINLDQSLNSIDDHRFVRPYFLIRPQTVLMLPNETAKFKCCFGGDPFPTLIWSHNESRIPEILATNSATSTRYQIHKLHDIYYLDIGPIKFSDNGQIKCILMNRFGREETIAQLFVVASPADGMPRIIQPLNNVMIVEGQPLKLSCNINGLQITVNWFHNGKLISPTTPLKSDYNDENAIFTLSRCLRTDIGTIDCLVKNRFGEVRTSCRIEVVNDPEFD